MYTYPISINCVARTKANKKEKPAYGRSLVARRAELGLSLADIERDTNGLVYDQLLWRIENGKKEPETMKVSQRMALAEALKWNPSQLDEVLGIPSSQLQGSLSDTSETMGSRLHAQQPGDRLKKLREEKDLTLEHAAELSGNAVSYRRLRNLEEREGAWLKITEAEATALAKAYGMGLMDFLNAVNGTPFPAKPNVYTDQVSLINPNLRYATRKIPKYRSVGMGPGGRDGELIGYVDIPETWQGNYFSYDAQGDSMLPLIPDGTELIIKEQSTADPDEVVLCYTPDEGTMLKVFSGVFGEGDIKLTSFNEAHPPIWTRELTVYGILWETRTAWKANGRRRK